jgi:hypothetical protein
LQSGSSHDGLDADVSRSGHAPCERERVLDLKKLTPGEITTAVSGVLLLVFSFFHWYSVSIDVGAFHASASRNGWQSPGAFWGIVAILIGIVLAAHVIVEKLSGVDLPDRLGSVGWGVVHLAGGGIALLFLLIKLLNESSSTAIGFYLGIIAAIGLTVGGYLMAKEAGELPGALGGAKGGSAPPPTA